MPLTRPTPEYVAARVAEMDRSPDFLLPDGALRLVFEQWPLNLSFDEVLAKAVLLDKLYSTNIYEIYSVARRIVDLGIDGRLAAGDGSLVLDIACVRRGEKVTNHTSFASKYCAWHSPDAFVIFDSFARWIICQYRREFRFARFHNYEADHYPRWVQIVDEFVGHFGLEQFTFRQLDKFLWSEGKAVWAARKAV